MSEDTATQTEAAAAEDQKAPAPAAPAPEQTSEVKAAPEAPANPELDAVKVLAETVSDLVDQVNNLGERLADIEKSVDGITTSDGMAGIIKGAVAAAITNVGSEFSALVKDVETIKGKIKHTF